MYDSPLCTRRHCDSQKILLCQMFPGLPPLHPASPLALTLAKDILSSIAKVSQFDFFLSATSPAILCNYTYTLQGGSVLFYSHYTLWILSTLIKESLDMPFWIVTFTFGKIDCHQCSRRHVLALGLFGLDFTSFGGYKNSL